MNPKIVTAALAAACAIGAVSLIVFGVHADREWNEDCVARGGHVITDTDVSTGSTFVNGQVVTTTTTTTDKFCLNDQGGIIKVG